jgi:hypothetical protein
MATLLVTYDLCAPARDYNSVHAYLRSFTHCKGMESVWLLDTAREPTVVRDELMKLVDRNDKVFVVRITSRWGSFNYTCADWLNRPERTF